MGERKEGEERERVRGGGGGVMGMVVAGMRMVVAVVYR
jgi:hypothetical protein